MSVLHGTKFTLAMFVEGAITMTLKAYHLPVSNWRRDGFTEYGPYIDGRSVSSWWGEVEGFSVHWVGAGQPPSVLTQHAQSGSPAAEAWERFRV